MFLELMLDFVLIAEIKTEGMKSIYDEKRNQLILEKEHKIT